MSVKAPLQVRRQLGKELRTARTLAGLTQRALAGLMESNQARVNRVEHGDTLPPQSEVMRWLAATNTGEELRERVLTLTQAAHSETWPWRAGMADGHLGDIAAADAAVAVRVRNYAMQWMPGLVQTAAYARALLAQVDPTGEMDIPAAVAARMASQSVLYEEGRRFELLFEEAALAWSPAVGVMPAQRDRLLSVATLDTVEVAVLPVDRVGASGWGPFMLWTMADGTVFATTEMPHGEQVITDADGVAAYEHLWVELWGAASRGDEAVEIIRKV